MRHQSRAKRSGQTAGARKRRAASDQLEEALVDAGLVEEAKERRAAGRPGIPLDQVKARLGL